MRILIVKTGALGDVLRTTSILEGLAGRHPGARIEWLTAAGAVDLVRLHPRVAEVHAVDPKDADAVAGLATELAERAYDRVLSFDDEQPLARLATRVAQGRTGVLSGAWEDARGELRYSEDVAPWFDMGLLSVHGKAQADRLKVVNTRTHPEIFAHMLGVSMGHPELPLPDSARAFAEAFQVDNGLLPDQLRIGVNTGAGGRWSSKKLTVERTAELLAELHRRLEGKVSFLLMGGRDERERNDGILAACDPAVRLVDAGTDNPLLRFAGLIDACDLLISSDSLALHMAIARRVPVVVFFAPTSAAEIELYGRGEKVVSTAPDYCSYRPDADTSSLTVERLADACTRVLSARLRRDGKPPRG